MWKIVLPGLTSNLLVSLVNLYTLAFHLQQRVTLNTVAATKQMNSDPYFTWQKQSIPSDSKQ